MFSPLLWAQIQAPIPAAAPLAFKLAPVTDGSGQTVALSISGSWLNSCIPQVDRVNMEAQGVVVLATSQATGACLPVSTPVALEVDLTDLSDVRNEDLNTKLNTDLGAQLDADLITGLKPGVYPVSLYLREQGQKQARLAGFDLLQLGSLPEFSPEAGLWWSESGGEYETSGPGVGFALEIQNGEAVLMSNTYGPAGGSRWLLSTGSLQGRIIRGDLTELGGGQTLFGEFRQPDRAQNFGRALLDFHSSSRATLWLVSQQTDMESPVDLLVQPISLVRFSIDPDNMLTGTWMLLPEDGGRATRLQLTQVESDRASVTLLDSSGATVTCRRLERRNLSPPDSCRFRGLEDIRFDDIGLNRWHGTDSNGVPYIAVRLDP